MSSGMFSWATDLTDLSSTSEYSQFFDHYFNQTNACLNVVLIGFGIALVIGALFYFWIGNTSFKLSTRLNWVIALLITGVVTFFVSTTYLTGHDGGEASSSSGVFLDSYTLQDDVALQIEENDDQLAEWNALSNDYRNAMSTGEFEIITEISIINTCYALLLFILFSFIVKRLTIHAKNIPF